MDKPLEGLHAIAYCRVSTDDKGQDTGVQVDAINRWAQAQGVIIDEVLAEDVSGAQWPRPKLSQALVTLATTQASILVCYDQSRLTRDASVQMPLIRQMIGNKIIRFVTDGGMDPESFGARMLSAVKSVTDSEERKVLKEKTKLALEYRRDTLHVHVGRPAKLVITDHPEEYNTGKIAKGPQDGKKTQTQIIRPEQLMKWARQGWAPSYVATNILNLSPQLFLKVLKESGYCEEYYSVLRESRTVA